MIDASCKLPWSDKNSALFRQDQVWHTDWPNDKTLSIADWVELNFKGHLPQWSGIDAALQLPWDNRNVALIKGDQVWHSDWPSDGRETLAEWVARNFGGKLPSWRSIDAACKLPWSDRNAALFKGDQVWHSDWPSDQTLSITDWVEVNFKGHLPQWSGIDAALQLPWDNRNVALIKGDQVWHSDWPSDGRETLAEWVARNFDGKLPEGWS